MLRWRSSSSLEGAVSGEISTQACAEIGDIYRKAGANASMLLVLKDVFELLQSRGVEAPGDFLIVFQGANDIRCKKPEADQIVKALADRGIDVPYMVKENEGHGFRNEENRFDVYRAMEHFLGKHLGGRVEPGTVMPEMTGTVDLPEETAEEAA